MKIAVVGATGLVGGVMLEVLKEQNLGDADLILAASEKSIGKRIQIGSKPYEVMSIHQALSKAPDIALFSAGSEVSRRYAPEFEKAGCFVIDNSSAWRMENNIPLIVPEINSDVLHSGNKIISNPNCSTIQLVLAIHGLHKKYGINRIVISTYQSVTGTGVKAVNQLYDERKGIIGPRAYPHEIDLNVIPHGGNFSDNGYTSEEEKLIFETRKILRDDRILISPTVVRVPVLGGHSESVNIEFRDDYHFDELQQILIQTEGVVLQDDPKENLYPMPLTAQHKDAVFVGRLRQDPSCSKAINMWIVADNLRKGAATNAVQIARYIIAKGWIKPDCF